MAKLFSIIKLDQKKNQEYLSKNNNNYKGWKEKIAKILLNMKLKWNYNKSRHDIRNFWTKIKIFWLHM